MFIDAFSFPGGSLHRLSCLEEAPRLVPLATALLFGPPSVYDLVVIFLVKLLQESQYKFKYWDYKRKQFILTRSKCRMFQCNITITINYLSYKQVLTTIYSLSWRKVPILCVYGYQLQRAQQNQQKHTCMNVFFVGSNAPSSLTRTCWKVLVMSTACTLENPQSSSTLPYPATVRRS